MLPSTTGGVVEGGHDYHWFEGMPERPWAGSTAMSAIVGHDDPEMPLFVAFRPGSSTGARVSSTKIRSAARR